MELCCSISPACGPQGLLESDGAEGSGASVSVSDDLSQQTSSEATPRPAVTSADAASALAGCQKINKVRQDVIRGPAADSSSHLHVQKVSV